MAKTATQVRLDGSVEHQLPDLTRVQIVGDRLYLLDPVGDHCTVMGADAIRALRCLLTSQCQLWDREDK